MSRVSTAPESISAPRPSGRWNWLILGFLLAIVALPIAAQCLPAEQARWTEARAVEAQLSGQMPEAIQLMQTAVDQSPEDRALQLRLAEFFQEQGEAAKAVEICNRLLELVGNPQSIAAIGGAGYLSRLYVCKVYSELQLGHPETALEFAQKREELSAHPRQTLEGLNSLAYIRGVTGLELEQAEWCIDEILKRFRRLPDARLSRPTDLLLQTLTAGAILSRRFNRQGDFLPLINAELNRLEQRQPEKERSLLAVAAREMLLLPPNRLPNGEVAIDDRIAVARIKQDRACLLLLRALLQDDLGNRDDCLADRRTARELGADEDRWLSELQTDADTLQFAETASNLLDTEACVRFKSAVTPGQLQQTLELLDVAIAVDEIVSLGWESDLPNQLQLNQDLRAWQRSVNRGLAVKLRHRSELLLMLELPEQAAADTARIRELGFPHAEILY